MIRYTLVPAALLLALLATSAGSASAQTPPQAPAAHEHESAGKSPGKNMNAQKPAAGRMARRGHPSDHVANDLNGCQMRPQAERQMCMGQMSRH